MAKTPKKPAAGKSAKAKTQKPVTTKVKKAVGVEKLEAVEQEVYAANDKDIDIALHRCLGHFGKLQPSEVQVVIKLLKPYYLTYGGHSTSGGMKVK
jgi:hypothetical protein